MIILGSGSAKNWTLFVEVSTMHLKMRPGLTFTPSSTPTPLLRCAHESAEIRILNRVERHLLIKGEADPGGWGMRAGHWGWGANRRPTPFPSGQWGQGARVAGRGRCTLHGLCSPRSSHTVTHRLCWTPRGGGWGVGQNFFELAHNWGRGGPTLAEKVPLKSTNPPLG